MFSGAVRLVVPSGQNHEGTFPVGKLFIGTEHQLVVLPDAASRTSDGLRYFARVGSYAGDESRSSLLGVA